MSESLDEIKRLLKRMQQGEAVTILQIEVIKKLVEGREIKLMEDNSALYDRIDEIRKLKEQHHQPQRVKKHMSRDDGLTDEFRAWLKKEWTNMDHHENT